MLFCFHKFSKTFSGFLQILAFFLGGGKYLNINSINLTPMQLSTPYGIYKFALSVLYCM